MLTRGTDAARFPRKYKELKHEKEKKRFYRRILKLNRYKFE